MSQTFLKSTLIITIATMLSKVLGSIFQIPLQNIAGDEVLGIFRLVYPVYMIALILSVAGIPIAISKLISEARAKGDQGEIREVFQTAARLGLLFGIVAFLMMVVFSKPISHALGGEFTRLPLILVSVTLLFAPYMAVFRGFFQGYEDMKPTALSQVLEQLLRVIFTLVLAYILVGMGASDEKVASWIMIGSVIGVLGSLLLLQKRYRSFARGIERQKLSWDRFKVVAKRILLISLPIAVGTLTMALFNLIDSVTIPHALKSIGTTDKDVQFLFGLYGGRGLSLVQMTVVFSSALILPLIPVISKAMAQRDQAQANEYIGRSLTFTHLVSWPIAVILFVAAAPINVTLFKDFSGTAVIAILGISSLFTSYTVLTTGILQGLNRSAQVAWLLVGATIVKGFCNYLFVIEMGVVGAAWATVLVYSLLAIAHVIWIKRITSYQSDWKKPTIIVVVSLGLAGILFVPFLFSEVDHWGRWEGFLYSLTVLPIGMLGYFLVTLQAIFSKEEKRSLPVIGRVYKKLERDY